MTGTSTIEVPADYAEDFRDAVLVEIEWDADRIRDAVADEQRFMLIAKNEAHDADVRGVDPPKQRRRFDKADIDGSVRSLRQSHDVLDAAWNREPRIEGDVSTLAHVLETMVDKILAPRLSDEANVSPINAGPITRTTDEIGWAVGEAARLEALWHAQHAAAKAEVA